MKIFITGATGYIGHAVACAFRRAGHSVFGLTRQQNGVHLLQQTEIYPLLGNLSEPAPWIHHAQEADVLIHCAVEYTADSVHRDAQAIETLLSAARTSDSSKTLIYTSGVWVYGNRTDTLCDETTPLNPIPKVAWRPKHEQIVLNAASPKLRAIVLRPGCVYGGAGGLTSLWFSPAAKKKTIPIIEGGNNRWAMIHRDDLASAYLLAAEKQLASTALNLTDESTLTTREMAQAVADAAGCPDAIASLSYTEALSIYGELVQGYAVNQCIGSQKAQQLLTWKPRHLNFAKEAPLYFDAWKMFQK